jgi:hypothetical protein
MASTWQLQSITDGSRRSKGAATTSKDNHIKLQYFPKTPQADNDAFVDNHPAYELATKSRQQYELQQFHTPS